MASLPIGSLSKPVELLRIVTSHFTVYLQGRPFHPTVESLQLHRREDQTWIDAHFYPVSLISHVQVQSVFVYSHEQKGLVPWEQGDGCSPLFYETQAYELVVEKEPDVALTFYHDNVNLRDAVLPKGNRLLSGMLNFQNEVGHTELELRLQGEPVFRMQLEIFPSKMDYKRDYQLILNEVNDQIYNLSFDFLRKTYNLMGLKQTQNQSLTEFFAILQHVFGQMVQAVERIQASPHHKLQTENRLLVAARIKQAGKENLAYLVKHPHLLVPDPKTGVVTIGGKKFSPTHILETKRRVEYNTLENRFVRWVLLKIQEKLKQLKQYISQKDRATDPNLISKMSRMQMDLQRLLKLDFLIVGELRQMTISLVLQMAPGYRDVYRYYLMLMKGLSIQSDLYRLSMKDLAQLYEYWCFLKIHQLLGQKYELIRQNFIKLNRGGLFVTLDRTKDAKMVYRNTRTGEEFTLFYNALPEGDRSKTISQRPDNVLTLKKKDATFEYKYIFDAKYRINPSYEGTSYHRDYKTPGPQEEDINTMHRYRDAIVYESGNVNSYERSMFGAYVLFPYPNEDEFREHHFYKSIQLVNVGAFPFLPNATSLVEQFLDEIILDSPEKAYERSLQPRGSQEYYVNKLAGKSVLIGALSSADQMKDALKHGFYHTPLTNISNNQSLTQLEYVAFYQSINKFGREQAGIYCYGKIKKWTVVPRYDIIEIPSRRGATSDLYVKFTVEEWLTRDRPILPGGHGVKSILFTSKYIFDRAEEVAELRLDTEEDLLNWREKRRVGKVKVKWDQEDVDRATRMERLDVEG